MTEELVEVVQYTKICLNNHITPDLGEDGEKGESGWALEEQLFHGHLVVKWEPDTVTVVGEMDSIAQIILQGKNSVGEVGKQASPLCHISHLTVSIDEVAATAFITSLASGTLHIPMICNLKQYACECPPGHSVLVTRLRRCMRR
jgi:hypothetical protein